MKLSLSVFMVLLFICNSIQAQRTDSLKYKYINESIYRYGNVMMKGTERISFQEMRNEFSMSETGMDAYLKAKKYKSTSMVFRIISMAAGIVLIGVVANHPTNNQRSLIYGLFGGQLVFSMVSGRYNALSNQTLDKAIWQRNKDLLFPQQ